MSNSTTSLTVFQFNPDTPIRSYLDEHGEPWFIAADVCTVLGIANSRDALSRLDEDEKGVVSTDTLGGSQQMAAVNESGLYNLIFTSRKAEAKSFKKWVTSEVLPALRKTGQYSVRQMSPLEILKQQVELMEAIEKRQAESERRIERLEETFEAEQGNPRMMTVRAYATFRGFRLSDGELASKGRAATSYSNAHGFPIDTQAHRTYGRINLYHVEVLQEIFKQRGMFEKR